MKLFVAICLLGKLIYSTDCPLCYAPYEHGDATYKTPCGHEFHQECIGEWIVNYNRSSCPYCIQMISDAEISHFKKLVEATSEFNRQLVLAENEDFSLDEKLTNVLNIRVMNEMMEIEAMRGKAITRLISQGAKCDAALHYAVKNANESLVKILLEKGADLDVIDTSGDSALMVAARTAQPEIMKVLLDAGADQDKMNSMNQNTALTYLQAGETAAKKMYCKSHMLNFFEEIEVYQEGGPTIILSKKKTSQFIGVVYDENNPNPWRAQRTNKTEKKMVYNGHYKDEETAAHASDTLARKLMAREGYAHKLNFPDDMTKIWSGKKISNFFGVRYDYNNPNPWRAQRRSTTEKKVVYNGHYKDEETAAHASDTLARELIGENHKLNFPDDKTEVYPVGEKKETSQYIGVFYDENSWCARRWSKREREMFSNGCYENEERAAQASDTLERWLENYSTRDCIKLAQIKACVALISNFQFLKISNFI